MPQEHTEGRPAHTLPSLVVRTSVKDQTCTIALEGELDMASVSQMETAIHDARATACRTMVIDLGGLEFMDSSGIHALLTLAAQLTEEGRALTVRPGHGRVQRALDVAGLTDLLPFSPPPPPTR